MKLEPPALSYLEGDKPTHSPLKSLGKHVKAWHQEEVEELLASAGYLSEEGKTTKLALQKGIADTCEGKVLWNILEVKRALITQNQVLENAKAAARAKLDKAQQRAKEPAWVDLGTVGTYFAVSNIVVGKWMDQLGMRAKPQYRVNESGAVDMLDVANEAKKKQADGFVGKEPTERAFTMGLARKITVMNRKQKEIEIVQWNLDLCKALLVKAGHELDTEHTWANKGRGKNGDVSVTTMADRAKELYLAWKRDYASPSLRKGSWKRFEKQPKPILLEVERLMNRPGYLVNREYLKGVPF